MFGAGGLSSLGSLNGGYARIRNGHLTDSDLTPTLTTLNNAGLEGVVVDTNLTVNGSLDIYNGLTLTDGTTLTVNDGTVWLNGSGVSGNTQHLAKTGGSSGASLHLNNAQIWIYDTVGHETLQIDAGVTVRGNGYILDDTGINTLANYGTIDASISGQILYVQPGTFINAGVLKTSQGNLSLAPTNTFDNSGIIEVAAGTTLFTNNHSLTNNAGGVLRGAGTLNLGGTSYTLTNNGTLNVGDGVSPGTGILTITGNLVNAGTINFGLNGLARGVAGTGYDALSVTGAVTLGGTLGIAAGASFTANNGDPFLLMSAGGTLGGTPTLTTSLAYNTQKPGNNYLFQVGATPATVVLWNTDSGGDWNTASNWLLGTVPGAGQIALVDRGSAVMPVLSCNSGSDTVARLVSTGSLVLNGGTLTLTGSNASLAGTLTLAGGNLAEAGAFKVGALTWNKGTVSGGGSLNSAGPVKLEPAAGANSDVFLDGATLVNNDASGNSHWTGLADIHFADGASFINNGSFTFQGSTAGIVHASGPAGSFVNQGTLVKSGTATQTFNSTDSFSNTGTVQVQAGTLVLAGGGSDSGSYQVSQNAALNFSGGSRTLGAGSNITGAGLVHVSGGQVIVNAGYDIASTGTTQVDGSGAANFNVPLAFAHGFTLTGISASMGGTGDLVMNGVFNWSNNADINGSGSITTNGATTISSNGNYMNRHWINTGTVTLSSGDTNVELANGTVFDNRGTLIIDSTRANPVANLWGGPAYFNNAGTVNWNGTGTQRIDSPIQFNNTGSVNVVSGTLSAPGFADNAGSLDVAPGATFQKSGGFTNTSAGVISGSGSIDVGSGTLVNAGTLRPGGSGVMGTLSIAGNLSNSGGIEMELGAPPPGSGHDRIAVSGSVQLGGTLTASTLNGYTPATGQDFDLITSSGASGSFTSLNLPTGMNGAIVGGNIYRLTNSGFNCAGVCWDGGAGMDTDWSNPANWTGDHLPGSNDVVYLNLVSGVEATHTTGADSIKGLNSSVGNNLTISGGSLSLSDAGTHSTLQGKLTVSNGEFTADGSLSLQNLTLSGGTLGGAGSITVGNGFNQSGGASSINRTGAVNITQTTGDLGFSALQVGALNLSAASGNLNLGAIHAGDAISATASGNITQNGDITSAATATAIVLAAGGGYSNTAGGLTAAGGRWLIYAADPAHVTKNGLTSNFRHYGATHSSYAAPPEAGNGFIYASAAGTLTVTPNAAESDYGNGPVTPGYTLSGFADNEDNAGDIGLGGTATFSGLPTQTSHAGSYGSAYNSGLNSGYGYLFASHGATGSYIVKPREVTLTVNNDHRDYGDANPATGTVATTPTAGSFVFGDSIGSVELTSNATAKTGANTAGQYLRAGSGTLIAGGGSTSVAGDYHVTYSDGTLSIERRPVTISGLSAQDKGYDNTTTAKLGYTDNRVSGDDLGLSYLADFSDVHAGAGKTVTVTGGYGLTGLDAGNYSLVTAGLPATFSASITPAASVAWTGAGTSGNWSNAANWVGNVLPQAGDVKSVSIPAGVSVAYDAGAGATNLESLTSAGNLTLSAGALSVGSAQMSHGAALAIQGGSHNLGGLVLDGSLNVDAGTLQLQGGGHFAAGGDIHVAAPGRLQFAGGVFAVDSVVSNAGTLVLQSGTTTFSERVSNSGLFAVQSGSAVFQGGYLQTAGTLMLGTSDVSGGNLTVGSSGLHIDGGALNGTGTIRGDVLIGAATLAPGFSPGRLDIYGNLDLTSSSTTDIELWGRNIGQYDVLNVAGTAHLDGVLNVSTGDGYAPVAGDGLAFMNFSGGSSGGFARMNLPTGVSMTFGPYGLSAATQASGVKQIMVYTNTQLSLGIVNQDTPTQLADTFAVTVLPLGGYSAGEILDATNTGSTLPDLIAIIKIDGEIKQLLDDAADHDNDHRLVCH